MLAMLFVENVVVTIPPQILATKDDECLALFKTVALSIGQTLKKAVYDFFAHSRRALDEQKSKTMLKKESKSKPQLVFEMETFEGHLIELSEKTQVRALILKTPPWCDE